MSFPPLKSIVTFESDAASLAMGVPSPVDFSKPLDRRLCVCGTVVAVRPMEPSGPGKVPSAAVTVEGRTKKRVTIDGAGCLLKVWSTWAEALAEVKRCNGTTPAALPVGGRKTG
jgi:hypothetical protein